ncbi:hypothetical protein [Krasilnikoviella flava]|uniref:DUF4287 domain-containing protein n=1 Tax=Krasilnikoviella flava TaxID=526729 RepID=A0A1T5KST4_9MICO|nr:hypothetical protein [Krasilnikoviella flava]SKC66832.1 hypothetical protein SAMN04324258_2374 [Krasilnikoviella flava]
MTTQESFKKRVRARMVATGERYGAARRTLLAQASPSDAPAARAWASEPDLSDDTIRASTGRAWDEWVALVDAGPGRDAGHTAIAAWVGEHPGVSGWWAQSVTVGYERITGLRVPGQRPDGTFSVSRSRLLDLDPAELRALLDDDGDRADLVPGLVLAPRSRAGVKSPRFRVSDADGEHGVVMFSLDPAGSRLRLTVTHERLGSATGAEQWREFWSEWLAALADA